MNSERQCTCSPDGNPASSIPCSAVYGMGPTSPAIGVANLRIANGSLAFLGGAVVTHHEATTGVPSGECIIAANTVSFIGRVCVTSR